MKKIILLSVVFVFVASLASATSLVFADGDAGKSLQATNPVNLLIGKCSKGVKLQVAYDGGGTTATAYAMQTVHLNGNKIYGTAYDSTAIYVKTPTTTAKDAFTAAPLTTSQSATAFTTAAGWSTL